MKLRLVLTLCALTGATFATPAWADNREQVQLRLPRCGAISDTRQYLDCYYAAIQPIRTELGLMRAPQSANYESLFALGNPPQGATLPPQIAATRELVVLRLTRCDTLTETRRYMDCFYAAAQPLRTELGLEAAPQATLYASLFGGMASPTPARAAAATQGRPNLVPQAAYQSGAAAPRVRGTGPTNLPILGTLIGISSRRVPEAQFGLPNAPTARNGVEYIASRVSDFDLDARTDRFTVTLENGQVWRQLAMDDKRASWKRGQQMVANIAYGAGDSFNLTVGDHRIYKVNRVR